MHQRYGPVSQKRSRSNRWGLLPHIRSARAGLPALGVLAVLIAVPQLSLADVLAVGTETIYPEEDAYVYSHNPDTNYGTEEKLCTGSLDPLQMFKSRSYLKFDLSSLENLWIVSAKLYLKTKNPGVSGDPFPMSQQVGTHYLGDDSWGETTITWNNSPKTFDGSPTQVRWVGLHDTWYSWGVTGIVRQALQDDMLLSIVVKRVNEGQHWVKFHSREVSGTADDPYLYIEYNNCPPPQTPPPPPPFVVYIDDAGISPNWGQDYLPEYWEPMDGGAPYDGPEFGQDLLLYPDPPFWAISGPMTGDYSAFYYADIWFANNGSGQSQLVVAELRRGSCPNGGPLIAADSVYVTNARPGQMYRFRFGEINNLVLSNESLVLKIILRGPVAWTTHIYWDRAEYPSALHAEVFVPASSGWGTLVLLLLLAATALALVGHRRRIAERWRA